MKKQIITGLIIGTLSIAALGMNGCSSCSRSLKSFDSDMSGGLNRTVTVYTNDGIPIKSWDGKIDLSKSEEEIMFDLNGKRVIIHGGITIVEEN